MCKQSIEEFSKYYGATHIHVATLYSVLATLHRRQRQYNEAATALNSALMIREIHFNKDHPIVINTINTLAYLYLKMNKYKEAEQFGIRGIEVRGRAVDINGSNQRMQDMKNSNNKRAALFREKYFNIIVSKTNQIAKDRTVLSTSNTYISNKIKNNFKNQDVL